jgi:hypothetical protein
LFEAAMAIKILAKHPNIGFEKAAEVYKQTIKEHIFEQNSLSHPLDFHLFNLLSNFNFSSFRLPVDNPAIINSKNAFSNSKNCVRFARMNPFDPMLVV